MGNSGLDGAISPTGVAFLEGEGAISPDTAKNPTPYSLIGNFLLVSMTLSHYFDTSHAFFRADLV